MSRKEYIKIVRSYPNNITRWPDVYSHNGNHNFINKLVYASVKGRIPNLALRSGSLRLFVESVPAQIWYSNTHVLEGSAMVPVEIVIMDDLPSVQLRKMLKGLKLYGMDIRGFSINLKYPSVAVVENMLPPEFHENVNKGRIRA